MKLIALLNKHVQLLSVIFNKYVYCVTVDRNTMKHLRAVPSPNLLAPPIGYLKGVL